ncbi:glycine zipper family protein [Roseococcus sp. YIM B11640]|uniref:glycine zipper family protein n=1 Tax=Roseococcus sp. YIM B11640 TaxID=3133973 RepID=UPI003C7D762D
MKNAITLAAAALSLAACATYPPSGPSIVALPGQGKDYAQFQREDGYCQQQAGIGTGYVDPQAGTNAAVGSAVVGTALGAATGALIGAAAGNAGVGAAIGAGTGLAAGSVYGANAAAGTQYGAQGRFDTIYAQCMTAYGNTVQPMAVAAPAVPYYGSPYYAAAPVYPVPVPVPYPAYRPYYRGWGWGYGGYWGRRW